MPLVRLGSSQLQLPPLIDTIGYQNSDPDKLPCVSIDRTAHKSFDKKCA